MEACGAVNRGPMIIGLVGGIGAGKSTVADEFESIGCTIVRADAIAHEIIEHPEVRAQLLEQWGDSILNSRGQVDRRALAASALHDQAQRRVLEGITHPVIVRACESRIQAADPTVRAIVIDAPLLLEGGLADWCDVIVFIDADRATRHARAEARHGWPAGEAARRESLQMPLDEKRRTSHHVLVNAGDRAAIRRDVALLLDQIHSRTQ